MSTSDTGPVPNGRKRKQRNKNRYAALAEDVDVQTNGTIDAVPAMTLLEPPTGLTALVLRNHVFSDNVRLALVELLELPEMDVVKKAFLGLSVWSAQLWNLISRGEDPTARITGAATGRLPK